MAQKRHLHRDYNTSHCGEDASHILMTYDEAKADCPQCKKGLVDHHAEKARRATQIEEEAQKIRDQRAAEVEHMKKRVAEKEQAERERTDKMEERLSRLERLNRRPS